MAWLGDGVWNYRLDGARGSWLSLYMLEQIPLGGWDDDWHGQIREDPDDHNYVMERIGLIRW